jgi:hypothetical protein
MVFSPGSLMWMSAKELSAKGNDLERRHHRGVDDLPAHGQEPGLG